MERYVKKPEVVKAEPWDGGEHEDVVTNHGQTPRAFPFNNDTVLIPINMGMMRENGQMLTKGDYIVHEGAAVRAVSAETFETIYETFESIFGKVIDASPACNDCPGYGNCGTTPDKCGVANESTEDSALGGSGTDEGGE